MALQIYVKMTCDKCGKDKILENTEVGEFYSDYIYNPKDYNWKLTFPDPNTGILLCPKCFEIEINKNPNLQVI